MNVLIIGAGGHGRVVLDILQARGEHNVIGFLDADTSRAGASVAGVGVLGPTNLLGKLKRQGAQAAIVAIGDNRVRQTYAQLVTESGLELINAIHPSAAVSPAARLGRNLVIAALAVVGPEASLADSVIVNNAAVVDHECEIGSAAHICPGALLAGRVRIGERAFIGLGAKVIPCLSIGAGATVGAGAVVIRDVPDGATVVGVPARVIKTA